MGWKHKACISLEVQRGLKIKRRSGGKGFADPNTFFFFPKQSKKDHRPRASWAQAPQFHTKQIKFVNCTVCYIFHVDKNPLESIGRKEKEPFYALPLERKGELLDRMTQGVWLTVPTLESLGPERAWKIPGSTGPWHGEGCMASHLWFHFSWTCRTVRKTPWAACAASLWSLKDTSQRVALPHYTRRGPRPWEEVSDSPLAGVCKSRS